MTDRQTIQGFEVVSLDGRDLVTIVINGVAYDTPTAVASLLARDIQKGVKRAKGGAR